MPAIWLWVRRDLARRLRSVFVLAVLIALAGGVVMAAIAGARRDSTAYARLERRILPADAMILANQPGFDWGPVRALPEIATLALFPVSNYTIDGDPTGGQAAGFPPASPEGMVQIERPLIIKGQAPDQSRTDEAMMSPDLAAAGYRIGQVLTLRGYRADKIDSYISGRDFPAQGDGTPQRVTIVGEGKGSFIFNTIVPTYAYYQRYRAELIGDLGYVNAVVRLRHGEADITQLEQDTARLFGHPVEIRDHAAEGKRSKQATAVEADALLGFALAAGLAALALLGQAAVRLVNAAAVDLPILRALGFRSGQGVLALTAAPLLAGVAGTLGAIPVAYALSPRFPIGLGRTLEPSPGRHADWVVLGASAAALLIAVVGGLAASGALQLVRDGQPGRPRASRLAATVSALGLPVPVVLGTRLALEPGHGRSKVPVRPALFGAVVGVLGVVGAFTFHDGLDRATTDARLYGQRHDADFHVNGSTSAATSPDVARAFQVVAADPSVEMVARANIAVLTVAGRNVAVYGLDPVKGDFGVAIISGREPQRLDEIVLGPQPQEALHVRLGQRVQVQDLAGGVVSYTLVGIGFVPEDGHTAYDQGGWMTQAGLDRVVHASSQYKFVSYLVRLRPGVDKAAVITRLNGGPAHGMLSPAITPEEQTNLAGVRRVPLALGGFLALLAIAAVGHALVTAVRRRRHDIAVLRVLGMRRTQARACMAWQATTLAAVGLVVGIPIGLGVGRLTWRLVAQSTPVVYVAPLAALAAALVVPAALALANLVAVWPGRIAARLRPSELLRAE